MGDFLDALPPGCVAVADEAYVDYIDPAERIDRLADIRAGRPVIVLRTFSKIFGLAGLRLGYLLVTESLAPHVNAVQEPFNVNLAALSAGIASLAAPSSCRRGAIRSARARARLTEPLAQSGIRAVDSDANFVLLALVRPRRRGGRRCPCPRRSARPSRHRVRPAGLHPRHHRRHDVMDLVAAKLAAVSAR